jgi:phosphatidylserine decarboxylase
MLFMQVNLEPELRTNRAVSRMVHSLAAEERVYEPEGTGVVVKKGEEVPCLSCDCGRVVNGRVMVMFVCLFQHNLQIAGFKMGSTVVLVFEAPARRQKSRELSSASADLSFCVRAGDKVRVGEAIGRWSEES